MLRARARRRLVPGTMNQLEARYFTYLRGEASGPFPKVASLRFEGLKLRLAEKTFYTPDFYVVRWDGRIEFHEVKGFWEEDARIKIKVAAEMFPEFYFVGVTWDRRAGWKYERFGREDKDEDKQDNTPTQDAAASAC